MRHRKFKVGDLLTCVSNLKKNRLTVGGFYKVVELKGFGKLTGAPLIAVKDVSTGTIVSKAKEDRFVLMVEPAPKIQKVKEPKPKITIDKDQLTIK